MILIFYAFMIYYIFPYDFYNTYFTFLLYVVIYMLFYDTHLYFTHFI